MSERAAGERLERLVRNCISLTPLFVGGDCRLNRCFIKPGVWAYRIPKCLRYKQRRKLGIIQLHSGIHNFNAIAPTRCLCSFHEHCSSRILLWQDGGIGSGVDVVNGLCHGRYLITSAKRISPIFQIVIRCAAPNNAQHCRQTECSQPNHFLIPNAQLSGGQYGAPFAQQWRSHAQ